MESLLTPDALLWEERGRAARAQAQIDRRSYLKRFAMTLALIVIIVAITMLLPDLVNIRPTSL
jgi:putative copper export protein